VRTRSLVVAAVVTVVVATGAQGAVAAERPSLADDIAARLGISPERLREAVKAALVARIDAAVAAGKLTPERAAELKDRIAKAQGLGLGIGRGFAKKQKAFTARLVAKAKGLGSAADYLGMTRTELRAELRKGTSLAQIATAKGKTVAGLTAAMLAPAKARLDRAVADGRLTRARADEVLDRLEQRLEKLVQRTFEAKG
jgi:hypothetical protein